MKILLNGATAGSNFGDFLFAKMFQNVVSDHVGLDNTYWYRSYTTYSNFFESKLNNFKKYKLRNMRALVCISGGYFCGDDKKLRDYVFRYLNYFLICMRCHMRKIPYGIFGVEVGKSKNPLVQKIQEFVLKNAQIVIVRNKNSYEYAKQWGVRNLMCTADTVFAMDNSLFAHADLNQEVAACDKKLLLLHINGRQGNLSIQEKVIPIVNRFLRSHPEYGVVITPDQAIEDQDEVAEEIAKQITCDCIIRNHYDDPLALCKVIEAVDVVVTTKLHVGIVGAKLNKSVISFSGHSEKIGRLYDELGESARTIALSELDEITGLDMLEKFHSVPINVSDDIVNKAKMNINSLSEFLTQLSGK